MRKLIVFLLALTCFSCFKFVTISHCDERVIIQQEPSNRDDITTFLDFGKVILDTQGGKKPATASQQETAIQMLALTADKGACFIATAAFGTPMAKEVKTLEKFRDQKLFNSKPGRAFVKAYYKISPSIADFIRPRPALRSMTRKLLKPIIWYAKRNIS